MDKNFKKIVAVAMAATLAVTAWGTSNILKSKADEVSVKKYERANHIELDESSELVISRNELGDTPMGKEDSWTIMVYMCGSDLESGVGAATTDIQEMINANYNEDVNVIIQTGGATEWQQFGIKNDKIGRYIIKDDKLELIENLENANMAESSTLQNFVEYGVENYPAEHMGMIYWNHGGGSIYGACMDEHYGDMLTLSEFEKALANGTKNMTNKFDFVGFDACLMATLETANTFVPFADYMIASEEAESSEGWMYTDILNTLSENTDLDVVELGKIIIDSFFNENIACASEDTATLSMTDLSKIDEVLVKFNHVAKMMDELTVTKEDVTMFTKLAHIAENYSEGSGYDLIDFTDFMMNIEDLIPEASEVIALMENAIVYEKHGEVFQDTKGLSFYYCYGNLDMSQVNILRNITVSPYLLNFIEKIMYGRLNDGSIEGFVSNKWQDNAKYYYDENYDFVDYEFIEIEDYSDDLRNQAYFKDAAWDDVWYNWFKDAGYIGDDYIDEEDIIFEEELDEELEVDGKTLDNSLSEGDLSETAKANYRVVIDNEESMTVIGDLGSIDQETAYDGTWFTLTNGSVISAKKVHEGNSLTKYTTKVLLDGEEKYVSFVADKFGEVYIVSTWSGMDKETKSAGRVETGIKEGVSITPVYETIDYVTGKVTTTYGETTISSKDVITTASLADSAVVLELTDAFGYRTFSKPVAK